MLPYCGVCYAVLLKIVSQPATGSLKIRNASHIAWSTNAFRFQAVLARYDSISGNKKSLQSALLGPGRPLGLTPGLRQEHPQFPRPTVQHGSVKYDASPEVCPFGQYDDYSLAAGDHLKAAPVTVPGPETIPVCIAGPVRRSWWL